MLKPNHNSCDDMLLANQLQVLLREETADWTKSLRAQDGL